MSKQKMMSVAEARDYITRMEERGHEDLTTLTAARTIVAQAEQIETLSRLLSGAEEAAIERAEQIERLQAALREAGTLEGDTDE